MKIKRPKCRNSLTDTIIGKLRREWLFEELYYCWSNWASLPLTKRGLLKATFSDVETPVNLLQKGVPFYVLVSSICYPLTSLDPLLFIKRYCDLDEEVLKGSQFGQKKLPKYLHSSI